MDCFGRDNESSALWAQFKENNNLLMLAPRRIGKTVLLNHLREDAAEQGFRAIILDVQGFREEKEFFRECCAVIQEELSTGTKVMTAFTDRLGRLLKGQAEGKADWRQWLAETNWQEFADHLFAHLDEHNDDPPWLILVDELPVFIQALHENGGTAAIEQFLYWLRRMRQKHQRIRWIYAGSIGLDTIARRYNIEGALNDLDLFTLGPFDRPISRAFLSDIARRRGCSFSDEAADAVLERLGWLSPYYLERIAEDACAQIDDGGAISPEVVHTAMDRLLALDKRLYWANWREHLDRHFSEPDLGHLHLILETVAKDEAGVDKNILLAALNRGGEPFDEVMLRDLLDTLLADGYLFQDDEGRYRFRMNLLREWWLRYVVL